MTWMWLSIIVILVGAKLNADIEHQTAREAPPARLSRSAGAERSLQACDGPVVSAIFASPIV
jgi:membrane protein